MNRMEKKQVTTGCFQYWKSLKDNGEPVCVATLLRTGDEWRVNFARFHDGDNAKFTPSDLHQLAHDLSKLQNPQLVIQAAPKKAAFNYFDFLTFHFKIILLYTPYSLMTRGVCSVSLLVSLVSISILASLLCSKLFHHINHQATNPKRLKSQFQVCKKITPIKPYSVSPAPVKLSPLPM